MHEIYEKVVDVVRAILRFRWTVLFVAWAILVPGWAAIWQLDDMYTARARIFVDSNQILKPLLEGIAIQPDVNERVALLSRTLLNRPNLEKLARETDLSSRRS